MEYENPKTAFWNAVFSIMSISIIMILVYCFTLMNAASKNETNYLIISQIVHVVFLIIGIYLLNCEEGIYQNSIEAKENLDILIDSSPNYC